MIAAYTVPTAIPVGEKKFEKNRKITKNIEKHTNRKKITPENFFELLMQSNLVFKFFPFLYNYHTIGTNRPAGTPEPTPWYIT